MAFTKITGPGIHTLSNIMTHNVKSSGIITAVNGNLTGWLAVGSTASFGGDVSVGGTLTYDDVTNIDSVGLITARAGIHVGAGGSIIHAVSGNDGQVLINAVAVEGGDNTKLCVVGSGTPNINPSTIAASTLATFRMTGGLSHAAGISIIAGNTGSSVLNFGDRDSELIGRVLYNHTTDNLQDYMDFYVRGDKRLRVTGIGSVQIAGGASGHLQIDANGEFELFEQDTSLAMNNSSKISMDFDSTKRIARLRSTHNGSHANSVSRSLAFFIGSTEAIRIRDTNLNVGIGTTNPLDKLSIAAAPNSLVLGAKDTTRNNHIFQILADDSAGNGELRLYKNSGSGTHEKTVEIASSGDTYFMGGDVGIGTDSISQPLNIRRSSVDQAEFGVRLEYENLTGPTVTSAAVLVNGNGLQFRNYNSSRTFIFNNGHVGIGTLVPTAPRFSSTVSGLLHLRGTKPSLYISEQDNHDPDGKERAIFAGLSGGSAFIGSNGDDGISFQTGNGSTSTKLSINTVGICSIITAGNINDGSYYSTLTINNTGSNTWSRLRFDRNRVAKWGLSLGTDDKFRITNLYTNGTAANPDDDCLVISNTSKISIGEDDPEDNHVLIRGSSTVGTKSGHIMLTGDSATVDEGPQIVFSESGSGSSYAGGYVGFLRQGSNSIGDLVFGTRETSGNADTVPDERLRITSTGNVVIGHNSANAKLHLASGTSSAVGDSSNPALQIGNTTNYRFGLYTDNETAFFYNKNGDDGFHFLTKTTSGGNATKFKIHKDEVYGVDNFAQTGTGNQSNVNQPHPTGVIEWQNNSDNTIQRYNCYIQATGQDENDMYITVRNSSFYRITVKASHNSTQADVAMYLVYGLNSQVASNRITEVIDTGQFDCTNHNTHVNSHDSTIKISYGGSANQGLRAFVETIGGF